MENYITKAAAAEQQQTTATTTTICWSGIRLKEGTMFFLTTGKIG